MEAVLCIIFSVFAVYGLYSALRECVRFIDRVTVRRDPPSHGCERIDNNDMTTGCVGCGIHLHSNSDEENGE